jgi:hypothetical protein
MTQGAALMSQGRGVLERGIMRAMRGRKSGLLPFPVALPAVRSSRPFPSSQFCVVRTVLLWSTPGASADDADGLASAFGGLGLDEHLRPQLSAGHCSAMFPPMQRTPATSSSRTSPRRFLSNSTTSATRASSSSTATSLASSPSRPSTRRQAAFTSAAAPRRAAAASRSRSRRRRSTPRTAPRASPRSS